MNSRAGSIFWAPGSCTARWPDIKLRLYQKDRGICTGREPHDHVLVDGPVKRLRGCLYHYTYDDLADQVTTLNRFSTISSEGMFREGRRMSVVDLLFRPVFRFFKGYIIKHGFMDGYRGLIIAVVSAMGVFLKYAKLWEMSNVSVSKPPKQPPK